MKKALCVFAMLALVASVHADIDLFCTAQTDFDAMADAYDFETAPMDFLPHFNGVGGVPCPTIDTAVTPTETIYVWGTFVNEDVGRKIQGMHILADVTGDLVVNNDAIYRQAVTGWPSFVRWDGDAPLHLYGDPATTGICAAVTAQGIVNAPTPDLIVDGTFLIGAIQVTGTEGTVELGLGTLGLRYQNDPPRPIVNICGNAVSANPPAAAEFYTCATFVPEPASLLVLALGALALRRR